MVIFEYWKLTIQEGLRALKKKKNSQRTSQWGSKEKHPNSSITLKRHCLQ